MNKISTFLTSRIDRGDFPSAVYLVAEGGEVCVQDALGYAVVEPKKIRTDVRTIYDLASLTKPLVTGLLAAILIDKGEIRLSDKASRHFAELDQIDKQNITIQHLLTHTSGFTAWKPFYLLGNAANPKESVFNEIASEGLEYETDSKVVYSDLNFLILGFLIEKIFEMPFDEVATTEIFTPLGLNHTNFNPPEAMREMIAASEMGNAYERKMVEDMFPDDEIATSLFRDELIWGEVHDNNCFFLNGVAGHAGIFSNVRETLEIAKQFLPDSTSILKKETCMLFTRNLTPDLNQARSIAFQLAKTIDSTAGKTLSDSSFGHLGFTGTSLWIDPERKRIYILLTNRTHDRDLPLADLKETRQRFHEIADDLLAETD